MVKFKRSYNEDKNDYDNVDRAVENSEQSQNYDEDVEGYNVDYRKNQTKQNKKTKKGLSNYFK